LISLYTIGSLIQSKIKMKIVYIIAAFLADEYNDKFEKLQAIQNAIDDFLEIQTEVLTEVR